MDSERRPDTLRGSRKPRGTPASAESSSLDREKQLFLEALELQPPEREVFLDRVCGADVELREQMARLIDAHERAVIDRTGDLLDRAADEAAGPAAMIGQRLGPYRITGRIASGGMGVVYEAEQDKPRRTVALKVIRPDLVTPRVLRRFAHEAEFLGRLEHPGIAHIYEAGTATLEHGEQPYLAMELVRGQPLDEFADRAGLDVPERLRLFAAVCDAVHHAHQKAVIHRDLKPANILVDASGQPKVVDFGIARLTETDTQVTTLQTGVGQLIGTMPFMSPEQVRGNSAELDTRSDVYSLGVVGYLLLAGRLPYELSDAPIPEAARVISEQDPAPLSSIRREFRGDIETIFARALEKDKERRYGSAAALAADVHRYLDDQPIIARPATTWYQIRKFARRHKGVVGSLVALFCVLVVGTVVSLSQAARATAAEGDALGQLAEARRQMRKALRINQFLNKDLLGAIDFERGGNKDVTVRQVLDRAETTIEDKFGDEPLVEAGIRLAVGQAYRSLTLHDRAEPHLVEAARLFEAEAGAENQETLIAAHELARLRRAQGQLEPAESTLRKTLEIARRTLGEHHITTLSVHHELGGVLLQRGKFGEAESAFRDTLEAARAALRPEHELMLKCLNDVGIVYLRLGQHARAEAHLSELLAVRRRTLGEHHHNTLSTMNALAGAFYHLERFDDAEPLWVEILDVRRRTLGEEHGHTLITASNLAALYDRTARYPEAESLHTKTLAIRRRVLGDNHPHTLQSKLNLGATYRKQDRFEMAEPLLTAAVEGRRDKLGKDHPATLIAMSNLATLYRDQERYQDAARLALETFEGMRSRLGADHRDTKIVVDLVAEIYEVQGMTEKARAWRVEHAGGKE